MQVHRVGQWPGEAEILRSALADFTVDGPRQDYADWLRAKGDNSRANVVEKTITAFHTLDAQHLDNPEGTPEWLTMIAVPLLFEFINRTSELSRVEASDFRDLVFSNLKPALSLDYSPMDVEPPLGTGKLWGLPDLPTGQNWPKVDQAAWFGGEKHDLPQDRHCAFIGQISFADINGTTLGCDLPKQGGFAVFAITEVHRLGIVETVIIDWDNRQSLTRRDAPEDLLEDVMGDGVNKPELPHKIVLREVLSLPDATDGPFAEIIPNCGCGEPLNGIYCELMEACGENHFGLGGYLMGTSGGDPSPDTQSLRMAVLRTNSDTGVVHFSIQADDLRKGRLDRVQYVWSDWDG